MSSEWFNCQILELLVPRAKDVWTDLVLLVTYAQDGDEVHVCITA